MAALEAEVAALVGAVGEADEGAGADADAGVWALEVAAKRQAQEQQPAENAFKSASKKARTKAGGASQFGSLQLAQHEKGSLARRLVGKGKAAAAADVAEAEESQPLEPAPKKRARRVTKAAAASAGDAEAPASDAASTVEVAEPAPKKRPRGQGKKAAVGKAANVEVRAEELEPIDASAADVGSASD